MKTIKLHGEDYTLGSPAICIGMNYNCFKVIAKTKLIEIDGKLYMSEKHFDMEVHNINDYYIDTLINRKLLKNIILNDGNSNI